MFLKSNRGGIVKSRSFDNGRKKYKGAKPEDGVSTTVTTESTMITV